MNRTRSTVALALSLTSITLANASELVMPETSHHALKPVAVLVHGAFADGSRQKLIATAIFSQSVASPAWKIIPSWYLVGSEDKAINPDQEHFYAKRMGATTTEIRSSHVPFISHPGAVVDLIEQTATTTVK